MGTLEDLDEGYDPNYTRAPGFPKMESHIRIYAFMNPTLNKRTFDYILYE